MSSEQYKTFCDDYDGYHVNELQWQLNVIAARGRIRKPPKVK